MYPVSDAYRQAMDAQIREVKALAKIELFVVDQTAYKDANLYISSPEWYKLSSAKSVLSQAPLTTEYASFEPKRFRLDGRQVLTPYSASSSDAEPQMWTGLDRAGDDGTLANQVRFIASFENPQSIPGLSVRWGLIEEDIPAEAVIEAVREDYSLYTINLKGEQLQLTTNVFFPEAMYRGARVSIVKVRNPRNRPRLARIDFGLIYTFDNEKILEIKEMHTTSPVQLTLPQASLTFKLSNDEGVFDEDSPGSLIPYLKEGQTVDVQYGLALADGDEWVPSKGWLLSSWSVAGSEATFSAIDVVGSLTQSYERDAFRTAPRVSYFLFGDVLQDAGVSQYNLSTNLRFSQIQAPLPVASHAEALQLLANRAQAYMGVDREGVLTVHAESPGSDPVLDLGPDAIYQGATSEMQPKLAKVTAQAQAFTVAKEQDTVATVSVEPGSAEARIEHGLFDRIVAEVAQEYAGQASVTKQTHYAYVSYVTLAFKSGVTKPVDVVLKGYPITMSYRQLSSADAGALGEVMELNNPLYDLTNQGQEVQDVLDWVYQFYSRRFVRKMSTRGYPELDCNDYVTYGDDGRKGQVISTTLTFNGAFNEDITIRGE